MGIPVEEYLKTLPRERQARIKEGTRRLITEYDALQELRTAIGVTQDDLADILDVKQGNISRFESRDDHKISALAAYIAGLGGQLRLTARFKGKQVDLTPLIARAESDEKTEAARVK